MILSQFLVVPIFYGSKFRIFPNLIVVEETIALGAREISEAAIMRESIEFSMASSNPGISARRLLFIERVNMLRIMLK